MRKILMSTIDERVIRIVAEQLNIKAEEIKLEASFVNDLGADSLDIVELVMDLEEEFGVEIPDGDAEKIVTVKDTIEYIKAHAEAA
jgi:acyl carrier protein